MSRAPEYPLTGRNVLITGVSRRRGIGFAIARKLAEQGANLFIQHFSPHDFEQPTGGDNLDELIAELRAAQTAAASFSDLSLDLGVASSAAELVGVASARLGKLDTLICNHARSGSDGSIFEMSAESLDAHWTVNTRSTLLLTRHFAEQFRPQELQHTHPGVKQQRVPQNEFNTARVIWLTSGQMDGPMPGEVAYAASKAALAGLTSTVASELLSRGILLNTVNPGPVNTGYLDVETADRPLEALQAVLEKLPFGRFGAPDDPARMISWLISDEARWVVGQVLTSDGGFRLV